MGRDFFQGQGWRRRFVESAMKKSDKPALSHLSAQAQSAIDQNYKGTPLELIFIPQLQLVPRNEITSRVVQNPSSSNPPVPILYILPMPVSEIILSAHRGAILPVEILTIIFYMVIETYNQHYTRDIRGILLEEAHAIRAASQVCQRWRDVAFSCHRIWGTILNVDSSSTLWISELLGRSGSAPLTIQSTLSPAFQSQKWKLLLSHTHRFRSIDITVGNGDICLLLLIFREPAPSLESLTVKYHPDHECYRSVEVNCTVPQGLFAGVSPKLRSITFENLLFRWSPAGQVAQNIVRLDLSLSQKDLASFSYDYPSFPKMALPNLQELVASGNGRCFRSLSYLAIPSSCMVTLSFTQRDPDPSMTDDPLQWVADYLRGRQARQPPIYSWYLSTTESDSFAFHAGTKADPLDRPQFVLEYNGGEIAGIRLLRLLEFLHHEGVLHESVAMRLDLQASLYFSGGLPEKLANLLSQCPKLETLTLPGNSIENIMVQFLAKYPKATAHIRHLIIDGPYPASLSCILRVKSLLRQFALQPLKNGGEKLQKITFCIDDSRKYKSFKKGVADLAKVVDYVSLRPWVVRRGELIPRGWWSLGA